MEVASALKALLASSMVGVALLDRELRYVLVNERLAAIDGPSAAEHIGRTAAEIILPEAVRDAVVACLRRVVARGLPELGRVIEGERYSIVDFLPCDGGVAMVVLDHTGQRRAETALAQRLIYARLISELSAGFIRVEAAAIDEAIGAALAAVGRTLDVDRAQIGVLSDDGAAFRIAHEWLAPGVPSATPPAPVPVRVMAWSKLRLDAGEDLIVRRRADLPPEAAAERMMFEAGGTLAGVLVQLAIGRRAVGFVSVGQVRGERDWTDDELETLRLAAQIFASALDRKRADESLRDRLRFEHLLSSLSTPLIHAPVERIDAAIEETLRAIGEAQPIGRAIVQLLDDERKRFLPTYEWCAPGVSSFKASMTGLPIAQFGWPLSQIAAGEQMTVYGDAIPEHAAGARLVMERDGFDALCTVPLVIAGRVVGFIGFHLSRAPRPIPESFIAQLRLVGEMVANALARKQAEEARRRAYDELAALKSSIERERDFLREEILNERSFGDIIGASDTLRAALERVDAVAATTATVLLHGESGVGKELFARALHERSARAAGPLVKVNCASIPKDLFESEFFGHVRGAFTGALKDRAGRFELADGGTLFLDEVGDIPVDLQAKLLRVLQEGELERLGDERTRRVDVRIVAATHRDLEAEVAAGRFRGDLFYRLSVFPIEIPPLRARRADIGRLAEHFLLHYARSMGRSGLAMSPSQVAQLEAYDWPGNIRELRHVIERAVILSRTPPLRLDLALPELKSSSSPAPTRASPGLRTEAEMRALERENLLAALERAGWRISGSGGAAELLGVRPSTLRDRIKALGIQRPS